MAKKSTLSYDNFFFKQAIWQLLKQSKQVPFLCHVHIIIFTGNYHYQNQMEKQWPHKNSLYKQLRPENSKSGKMQEISIFCTHVIFYRKPSANWDHLFWTSSKEITIVSLRETVIAFTEWPKCLFLSGNIIFYLHQHVLLKHSNRWKSALKRHTVNLADQTIKNPINNEIW